MKLCDKIINKIIFISKVEAENEALDTVVKNDDFADEENENEIRLKRVVNRGKIERAKIEIKPLFDQYLKLGSS